MSQNYCIVITIISAFIRETDKSFIIYHFNNYHFWDILHRMLMSVLAKSIKTGAASIERHLECK